MDDNRALVVSKITAPRVNFIKSPYDDDFKAAACPAATNGCQKESYLVTGDLVLVGKTSRRFHLRRLPITAGEKPDLDQRLAAEHSADTDRADDIANNVGLDRHVVPSGGPIEIKSGDGGKLHVEGVMTLPTPSGDFQNGDFKAQVVPQNTLAFTDEGAYGDGCHVRMQRIGPWLLVEDNGGCGGSGVTFTGLYRPKN